MSRTDYWKRDGRSELSKTEVAQMNTSCAWFEEEYQTDKVKRILIAPTKSISNASAFAYDIKIMKKGKLNDLKKSIKSFITELGDYNIKEISDDKLQEFLIFHKLDLKSLKDNYCEDHYREKN